MSDRQPPIAYLERITEQYEALGYGAYQWVHAVDGPAMAVPDRPLGACRVAMVATGGVYAVGQTAFTHRDDTTYRAIASDVDIASLRATHFAYDLTDAHRDINVVFPIEPLRALAADGVIGALAPSMFTCMGGIYSSRRVVEELAPAFVERCLADEVDIALLVPV